jgi:hypothetical protein
VAIREATSADWPLLVELNPSGHAWEPYQIRRALSSPRTLWMVDDQARAVCGLRADPGAKTLEVAWLLPRSAGLSVLRPLLRASLVEALSRLPATAGTWTFFGNITRATPGDEGDRAAQTWKAVFSRNGAGLILTEEARHIRCEWPKLSEIRQAVEGA